MRKFIGTLLIFTLFLTGCESPEETNGYYPGQNPSENVEYKEVISSGPVIEFHMTIVTNEQSTLEEFIEVENFEFEYNHVGFGYGLGFEDELLYGTNYMFVLNGNELINISDITLESNITYSLVIRLDFSNEERFENAIKLENTILEIVVNENNVLLIEEN